MIETLESFKQGEEDTKGKSKQIFIDFFDTEQASFSKFKNVSTDFLLKDPMWNSSSRRSN